MYDTPGANQYLLHQASIVRVTTNSLGVCYVLNSSSGALTLLYNEPDSLIFVTISESISALFVKECRTRGILMVMTVSCTINITGIPHSSENLYSEHFLWL